MAHGHAARRSTPERFVARCASPQLASTAKHSRIAHRRYGERQCRPQRGRVLRWQKVVFEPQLATAVWSRCPTRARLRGAPSAPAVAAKSCSWPEPSLCSIPTLRKSVSDGAEARHEVSMPPSWRGRAPPPQTELADRAFANRWRHAEVWQGRGSAYQHEGGTRSASPEMPLKIT